VRSLALTKPPATEAPGIFLPDLYDPAKHAALGTRKPTENARVRLFIACFFNSLPGDRATFLHRGQNVLDQMSTAVRRSGGGLRLV